MAPMYLSAILLCAVAEAAVLDLSSLASFMLVPFLVWRARCVCSLSTLSTNLAFRFD